MSPKVKSAVLEKLIEAVRPGLTPGHVAPDPELTARTLSAIADEYGRLLLTDPDTFSVDRLLRHARWFLGQIGAGADAETRWSWAPSEPLAADLGGLEPR